MKRRERQWNQMGKKTRSEVLQVDKIAEDRLSALPDEILSITLSFLSMREAARTSILSCRWRYLWKSTFSSVNLDVGNLIGETLSDITERHLWLQQKLKFVKCVHQILQIQQCPKLESFKLDFPISEALYHLHHDIDEWVRVAIAKGIEKLELNLSEKLDDLFPGSLCVSHRTPEVKLLYKFPYWLFIDQHESSVKYLYLNGCFYGQPLDFKSSLCFSLKTLVLKNVDLVEGNVDNILSSSSNLEEFTMDSCWTEVDFKVAGSPSLKLKMLVIVHCNAIENIEISAPNLTKFNFTGVATVLNEPLLEFSFKNVPKLVNAIILMTWGYFQIASVCPLDGISTILSQLESLIFQGDRVMCYRNGIPGELDVSPNSNFIPKAMSLFTNLKELIMITRSCKDFGDYMFLLQASPHLHRFELHLGSCERDEWDISPSDCPYLYLEEVLISGFYGFPLETQIAMYLLSSAKALKKMTLLCRDRGYDHEKGFHDLVPIFPEKEFGRKFKKQAEDACQWLQEVRPQGVRLLLE